MRRTIMSKQQVTTIQLTSKRLKGNKVFGWVLFFLGIVLITIGEPNSSMGTWGVVLLFYSVGHLIVTRVRVWWNHK